MYLIQLLLPLYDNDRQALPKSLFRTVTDELIERFGGLTTYSRAPASGYWLEDDDNTVHDESVVYEVMADELDREGGAVIALSWSRGFGRRLWWSGRTP